MKFFFVLLFIAFSLLSCKKKVTVDFNYDYFPIQKGNFVIYKVREIFVDTIQLVRDTNDFYMKCKFGDTLIDLSGKITNRYERYISNDMISWTLKDIWTGQLNGNKAELVEENNRTIKMVFAPSKSKSWDANAYNTLEPLNCYYDELFKSYTVNNQTFDKTLIVDQQDELNFIQFKRKYEVYAENIGLIKKWSKDFDIYNQDTTKIKKGNFLLMEYVSHGVE